MSSMQTAQSLGNGSGPLVQLVELTVATGGSWSIRELHTALAMGVAPYALYMGCILGLSTEHRKVSLVEEERRRSSTVDSQPPRTPAWNWVIAGLIEVSNFTTAVGSGMTFKYWPLFFKHDFNYSPSQVCLLQLSIWMGIAASSAFLNPVLLRYMDRLVASNVLHMSSTAILFIISIGSLGVWVEAPLVILRNALINSGGPLQAAMVMDLVPQQHRGKWSSILSLRRMTWSGSAFVGGILSDSHDYRYAFFITACVHTVAGLMLVFTNSLVCLRRRTEAAAAACEQPGT